LFPYISDPDTGSRIPSISTGGAAMKATMNTEVAVKRVGIIQKKVWPVKKNVRSKEILYSTQLEKKKHVFFILKKVLPFLSGDAAMKAKEALDLLKSFSSDFDTKMLKSLYLFYWDKESFLSQ
jgi:hypothetical protein